MPKKSKDPEPSSSKFQKLTNCIYNKLSSFLIKREAENQVHDAIKSLHSHVPNISAKEKSILNNFMSFCNKTVEDVMIPRSDIFAISSNISLSELNEKIIDKSHTRTLVYEDNLDNIVGFIHIKDLFKIIATKKTFSLKKLMRIPIIAAPSMELIDLLTEMQKARTHIAIVVDEYGGTDGIATIEDIIEALVGKIEDEHDNGKDDPRYKILNPSEILSEARVEIEEIEKILGFSIKTEDDDCDTIGGLILARIGHMPKKGETIYLTENVSAIIVESGPRMLKKIRLIINENNQI